jgi:hypothetical protein
MQTLYCALSPHLHSHNIGGGWCQGHLKALAADGRDGRQGAWLDLGGHCDTVDIHTGPIGWAAPGDLHASGGRQEGEVGQVGAGVPAGCPGGCGGCDACNKFINETVYLVKPLHKVTQQEGSGAVGSSTATGAAAVCTAPTAPKAHLDACVACYSCRHVLRRRWSNTAATRPSHADGLSMQTPGGGGQDQQQQPYCCCTVAERSGAHCVRVDQYVFIGHVKHLSGCMQSSLLLRVPRLIHLQVDRVPNLVPVLSPLVLYGEQDHHDYVVLGARFFACRTKTSPGPSNPESQLKPVLVVPASATRQQGGAPAWYNISSALTTFKVAINCMQPRGPSVVCSARSIPVILLSRKYPRASGRLTCACNRTHIGTRCT